MQYEATLRKIIIEPPSRLFELALGREVSIRRSLSTDFVKVDNLQPDTLLETTEGQLLHCELQGYRLRDFPVRNLIYKALIRRDYGRWPVQVVFWYGGDRVGIPAGISDPPDLHYNYRVINVAEIDAEDLLSGSPGDAVFSILCRMKHRRKTIVRILERVMTLPREKREEALAQVLILSGLRKLETAVRKEIRRMPLTFDIRENSFLHGIYADGQKKGRKEGREEGREEGRLEAVRALLLDSLETKFGAIPKRLRQKLLAAPLADLELWHHRLIHAESLPQIFG